MIEIVTVENPFDKTRRTVRRVSFTPGMTVAGYVAVEQCQLKEDEKIDLVLNGNFVEQPEATYPMDGDQIIILPHVGNGMKGIIGTIASIALSVYAGNVGSGLWGGVFAKGSVAAYLAAGAVMYIGGRIINALVPTQKANSRTNADTSQTYGWDTPSVVTGEGGIVGVTYGECIPAPQVLARHVETVNDKQYLNLLLCGGKGPVDEISNIRIDKTDISNFLDVQIETRLGTNDQEPISFFTDTPLDQAVGLEISEAGLVQTSDSQTAVSLEVVLEWGAGLYHINDDGSYSNVTVKLGIYYRKYGLTSWNSFGDNLSVTAAQSTALRRSFRVKNLEKARYDVKAIILSRPTGSRYATTTTWSMLTAYDEGQYARPNKVLVGVRILATNQLSGGIPSINWRQKRNTVYVWNPEEGQYVTKSARNPIWAAYDIYHQCEYLKNINTGEMEYVVYGVEHARLDPYWDEWVYAASYADEQVTGIEGTLENRFEFDYFYDTAMKRYEAAQRAATVGHATIVPRGNNIGVICDRLGQMVQIFGEGRTTMSSLQGTFTGTEDRAHVVEVVYSETANDFKNTPFLVRSPKWNTSNQVQDNPTQLQLYGVKRKSQAYREGMYTLANNELVVQFVDISTNIDAMVCEYGDIVGLNHSVPQIGMASGRIVAATENTVILDKEVLLQPDLSYQVIVTLSTDEIVIKNVMPVTEELTTNTIAVTESFLEIPQQFDNYAFGETDKAVKPFRVVGIEKTGDLNCTIKLAEYVEGVYSGDLDYPVIDYTPPGSGTAEVSGLSLSVQTQLLPSGDTVLYLHASWTLARSLEAREFVIYYSSDGGDTWQLWGRTEDMQATLTDVYAPMTYLVKVCTYNGLVQSSGVTETIVLETAGDPPDNLDYFSISYLNGKFVFSWKKEGGMPATATGYEFRKGDTWGSGQTIMRVTGKDSDYATFAAIAGTSKFWICPYNNHGYADTPLFDTVTIDSIPTQQTIASFKGYDKACTIEGPGLQTEELTLQLSNVTYADIKDKTYAELKTAPIIGSANGNVVLTGPVIDLGTLAQVMVIVDESWLLTPDNPNTYEISTSVDGANFSEYKLLTIGSIPAMAVKLRITMNGVKRPGVLRSLDVSITAQQNTLTFSDVEIPVGGLTIKFDPPFLNPPSLVVSPNGTVLTVVKSNVTNAEGTVSLYDTTGATDTGGRADVIAVGI